MAFRLKDAEAVGKGVRRIVRREIDRALDELTGHGEGNRDEAVHGARKRFKKARAVLRLVRDELGAKGPFPKSGEKTPFLFLPSQKMNENPLCPIADGRFSFANSVKAACSSEAAFFTTPCCKASYGLAEIDTFWECTLP